jgi:radical SAM superfamily enzyme YgiQ (UPF0313 family)
MPVAHMADHLENAVRRLGATYVTVWDDLFPLDEMEANELADELGRRRLPEFKMSVNLRSSSVDRGLCMALQRLNVVTWICGFESASDKVLARMKCGAKAADHRRMIELAREFRVALHASFMLGIPGETAEDMRLTLDFMRLLAEMRKAGKHKGNFWTFCATPLPGTGWWRLAAKEGMVSAGMDFSKLDIKNFDNPLLLDRSVSMERWREIVAEADKIVAESNSVYSALPRAGQAQ